MSKFKIGSHYDDAFIGMPGKEIKNNFEAIAYAVEERSYTKNLTPEEIIDKKDQYSKLGIELSELAIAKKEAMDSFKEKERAPKVEAEFLLQAIKFKSEQKFGELYLVDDQEAGIMYSFDNEGVCVDQRLLEKKERQLKLKTANNE